MELSTVGTGVGRGVILLMGFRVATGPGVLLLSTCERMVLLKALLLPREKTLGTTGGTAFVTVTLLLLPSVVVVVTDKPCPYFGPHVWSR